MQINAVNLRQQRETHDRSFCELYANTSAASKEICALLLDPREAARFQAYRGLVVDEQATVNIENFQMPQGEPTKSDYIHKLLADRQFLQKLHEFQIFRDRQRSKLPPAPQPRKIDSSSLLQTKDDLIDALDWRVYCSLLFLLIPAWFSLMVLVYSSSDPRSKLHGTSPPKAGHIDIEAVMRQHGIGRPCEKIVPKELSSSEYYMDRCGKAFVVIVGVFFAIRTCFRINDAAMLPKISFSSNVPIYAFGWCLVALAAMLFMYVWRVVNAGSAHVGDKLNRMEVKPRIRKKCPTCGSYSCYLRK
jgi:hypothetical protein